MKGISGNQLPVDKWEPWEHKGLPETEIHTYAHTNTQFTSSQKCTIDISTCWHHETEAHTCLRDHIRAEMCRQSALRFVLGVEQRSKSPLGLSVFVLWLTISQKHCNVLYEWIWPKKQVFPNSPTWWSSKWDPSSIFIKLHLQRHRFGDKLCSSIRQFSGAVIWFVTDLNTGPICPQCLPPRPPPSSLFFPRHVKGLIFLPLSDCWICRLPFMRDLQWKALHARRLMVCHFEIMAF